jgi:hypothetical protein
MSPHRSSVVHLRFAAAQARGHFWPSRKRGFLANPEMLAAAASCRTSVSGFFALEGRHTKCRI